MAKEDIIPVILKDILFGKDYFQGFRPADQTDYQSRILENYIWMRRGDDADKNSPEGNFSFKHPIAYSLVANLLLKQVFSYQRAQKGKGYDEGRLSGNWSWGVGGHIKKSDQQRGNIIQASFEREVLREEVEIQGSTNVRVLGYINDDSNYVGKVHFGILYLVETDATIVKPKDIEIAHGRLRTIKELEQICNDANFTVEGWSRIALQPLKLLLA